MPEKKRTDCVFYKKCEYRKTTRKTMKWLGIPEEAKNFCQACLNYVVERRKGERRKG